ncbi:MAG: hypothetical protein CL930_12595 [Deltaproteobacteria bacterium]|nr:hypothetical protein [Deltaproteobacteria bacterium]
MRFAAATLGFLLSAPSMAQAVESHDRVAVVIGLDQPSDSVPPLPNGQRHARALASALAEHAGYERIFTLIGTAATSETVIETTKQALGQTSDNGTLLFVYVGHGAGGDFGEAALLTRGATVDEPSTTGLSMERLAKVLRPRTGDQNIITMIDASHDGSVDGVALIGPSAEGWPDVPEWGLAITTPAARGLTAEAGELIPALTDGMSGLADENFDGHVTISELARYLGGRMSDQSGSLLNTAGAVAAGLKLSDAGQSKPVAVTPAEVVTSNADVVAASPAWSGRQIGAVTLMSVGGLSAAASVVMYASKRSECVDRDGQLRCGNDSSYRSYQVTQHMLGWAGAGMLTAGLGLQFIPASTGATVQVVGRF